MGEANRRGTREERLIEAKQRRLRQQTHFAQQMEQMKKSIDDETERKKAYEKMVSETIKDTFVKESVMDVFRSAPPPGSPKIILPNNGKNGGLIVP